MGCSFEEQSYTYAEFITNILNSRGRFACGIEYHERHHIIPRCMGGVNEDDNLIDLFAKEHFIAHKLLALENPTNYKLQYAWVMMAFVRDSNQQRYEVTPEEYEQAAIVHSQLTSKLFKGVPKSEEHKRKIRESNTGMHNHSGKNNPRYGKKGISKEGSSKIAESNRRRSGKNSAIAKSVARCDLDGQIINSWYSLSQAELDTKIDRHSIASAIKAGRPYKGYIWKLIDKEDVDIKAVSD